jgi:hypothetical protein
MPKRSSWTKSPQGPQARIRIDSVGGKWSESSSASYQLYKDVLWQSRTMPEHKDGRRRRRKRLRKASPSSSTTMEILSTQTHHWRTVSPRSTMRWMCLLCDKVLLSPTYLRVSARSTRLPNPSLPHHALTRHSRVHLDSHPLDSMPQG